MDHPCPQYARPHQGEKLFDVRIEFGQANADPDLVFPDKGEEPEELQKPRREKAP